MKKFIYPDYEFKDAKVDRIAYRNDVVDYHVEFSTYVRKEYNGKWYLIKVVTRSRKPDIVGLSEVDLVRFVSEQFDHFNYYCYKTLMFFKIDGALKLEIESNGRWKTLVELDSDQRSEYDRLNNIVRYNKLLFV